VERNAALWLLLWGYSVLDMKLDFLSFNLANAVKQMREGVEDGLTRHGGINVKG
jgi:hypothetical protein